MSPLTIALAQINPTVGAIDDNAKKIIAYAKKASNANADIVVFPELALTGYSPEDLLYRPEFIHCCEVSIRHIAKSLDKNISCLVGAPQYTLDGLFNGAYLIQNNEVVALYAKHFLPNRSVFDEHRYFIEGKEWLVFECKNKKFGVLICADQWHEESLEALKAKNIDALISLNASPFEIKKHLIRENTVAQCAKTLNAPVFYCNTIGGQDDLVFDGGSFVMTPEGRVATQAPYFEEALVQNTLPVHEAPPTKPMPRIEKIHRTLLLGTRDYIEKNHFKGVLVGNSGGIDSAVTLTLAVEALGAKRVRSVMMPSRFTATMSLEDALLLANNLGIRHEVIDIDSLYEDILSTLLPYFDNKAPDTTEENIQARCRGLILMALSNKSGDMVLSTSNRSEMAVGYSTLYGDMVGGYGVLKDVLKTDVYALAKRLNKIDKRIPERILTRAPSAELALDQKDEDFLPDYTTLDQIITLSIEEDKSLNDIVAKGFPIETVRKILDLIHRNEYKRRQSPPGVRINHRAFCKDRRYPITNGFVE